MTDVGTVFFNLPVSVDLHGCDVDVSLSGSLLCSIDQKHIRLIHVANDQGYKTKWSISIDKLHTYSKQVWLNILFVTHKAGENYSFTGNTKCKPWIKCLKNMMWGTWHSFA